MEAESVVSKGLQSSALASLSGFVTAHLRPIGVVVSVAPGAGHSSYVTQLIFYTWRDCYCSQFI